MGDAARALGMGSTLEYKGKVYTICGFTEGVKALYETYLERSVIAKAKKLRVHFNAAELLSNDPVDGARRDISVGSYSFGGKLFFESLNSVENMKMVILIMLQENHREVNRALVDEMFEKAQSDLMAAYQEADHDPNGQTPAQAGE
jgi:hypothetical protein